MSRHYDYEATKVITLGEARLDNWNISKYRMHARMPVDSDDTKLIILVELFSN